jgi:hypothetical protein
MFSYICVCIKRFSSDILYSIFSPQESDIQIISPYKGGDSTVSVLSSRAQWLLCVPLL